MAVGKVKKQQRFEVPRELLGDRLAGVYRFLADHGGVVFPEDYFADLFTESVRGRPTVPARLVATVMVLQAHEGLSDRDACDHLGRDLAWQAAAGVDTGCEPFHPTVLVGMRNRLRTSKRPKRFLEDTVRVARESGVMGNRARVVDSTPIFDAVATQDTVTQLRSGIRRLLVALDRQSPELAGRVRAVLRRDDAYATPGKPPCDWDDPAAREALVDGLVGDARAALGVLDGVELTGAAREAADLLAVIAGQDVEAGEDGVFRIARKVARDRTISTVDPEARHGHKSRNRRFDGYKGHIVADPDSEIIEDVTVTPANTADHEPVEDLLAGHDDDPDKPTVFGDCAYGGGETRKTLKDKGYDLMARVPPPVNRNGLYGKDEFVVDLDAGTVTCPAGQVTQIRFSADGSGRADFGDACGACPQRAACTTSTSGRSVSVGCHEQILQDAKAAQACPEWQAEYKATRPKVERKIAHLVRRTHGGRKARTRGTARVLTDFVTRAAAVNLARLSVIGVKPGHLGWQRAGP
jgi:hypothetical protein